MLDSFSSSDLWYMVRGKQLGAGSYRTVYECELNENWVIKYENESREFHNVSEYLTWEVVQHTKIKVWFAPLIGISPHGRFLIQERTYPLGDPPTHVPSCFTDLKSENWGRLKNGQIVCHDYGYMITNFSEQKKKINRSQW